MEYRYSSNRRLVGDGLEKGFTFCRRKSEEATFERRREVQEFSQDEQGEYRETYGQRLVWGIIALALIGCVRFLPEDAAYYKNKLEDCQRKHAECESELEICKDLGVDLLRCP